MDSTNASGSSALQAAYQESLAAQVRLRALADEIEATPRTKLVEINTSAALEAGTAALDELISFDRNRLRSLLILRDLASDSTAFGTVPRSRIAALIADRDGSEEKRDEISSQAWVNIGLAAGLNARDNRGDIVSRSNAAG